MSPTSNPRPQDRAALVKAIGEAHAAGQVTVPDGLVREGAVVLDLSAFDQVEVNVDSHVVRAGAGVLLPDLEDALGEVRLTLGWQELPPIPLGAFLATGEPGPSERRSLPGWSPVMALEVVLQDGTVMSTTVTPRSATGPDLKALLVGGRAEVGVIFAAVLRVHRHNPHRSSVGFVFDDYDDAVAALVEALGQDLFPDRVGLLDGGEGRSTLTWESSGAVGEVKLTEEALREICIAAGGSEVGAGPLGAQGVRQAAAEASSAASGVSLTARWSRVRPLREALRERGGRVHVERALPEGAALFVSVDGDESAVREVARQSGVWWPGSDDESGFYAEVGRVLRGVTA